MGVLLPQDCVEWWAPRDLHCLVCGEVPPGPLIFWQGATGALVLCPDDAAYLGAHLIGDAREATLASGRERHWAARATRAAVAAIEQRQRSR